MVVVVVVRTLAVTGAVSSCPDVDGGSPLRGGFHVDLKRTSVQSCRRPCVTGSMPKTGSCTVTSGGMVGETTVHPGYP